MVDVKPVGCINEHPLAVWVRVPTSPSVLKGVVLRYTGEQLRFYRTAAKMRRSDPLRKAIEKRIVELDYGRYKKYVVLQARLDRMKFHLNQSKGY